MNKDHRGATSERGSRQQRRRNCIVLTLCPLFSLSLVVGMIVDAMPRRRAADQSERRRRITERALEGVEELGAELATGRWPASREYGAIPCAINITGHVCNTRGATTLNQLYLLEQGSDVNTRTPAYRSSAGYWLVHSPHRCFERATWLISRTRPDESDQSAGAPHGGCEIEAHLFHSAALPVGSLRWSYVSCGVAGDAEATRRTLMLEPVKKCDCPTAGHASETDAAP